MTPTQIIRDWYAEHRNDIEECGIDGFHATELITVLAPLFAAGPWRYDVENAPKDGSDVWGEFVIGTQVMKMAVRWDIKRKFWRNDYFSLMGNQLHAFATVNLPETPNHA